MSKRLQALAEANLLIGEDIIKNDSFTTEDLIKVQAKTRRSRCVNQIKSHLDFGDEGISR